MLQRLFYLSLCITTLFANVPESEKTALEDLYTNTNGETWLYSANWMSADPCQNGWYGVTCMQIDEEDHVIGLSLSANALQGKLNASLGNLTYLKTLWLAENELYGELPDTLLALSNLDDAFGLSLSKNGVLETSNPELIEFAAKKSSFVGSYKESEELILTRVDFNLDGISDIFYRNTTTGQNVVWFMDGNLSRTSHKLLKSVGVDWSVEAIHDFNHDGISDILWRNQLKERNVLWIMDKTLSSHELIFLDDADSRNFVGGVADFNSDGNLDILFRNMYSGENEVWFLDSNYKKLSTQALPFASTDWYIETVNYFNNDKIPDILFRNRNNGQNTIMFLTSELLKDTYHSLPIQSNSYYFGNSDDYNGDGIIDILWSNDYESELWLLESDLSIKESTKISPSVTAPWRLFNNDRTIVTYSKPQSDEEICVANGGSWIGEAQLCDTSNTSNSSSSLSSLSDAQECLAKGGSWIESAQVCDTSSSYNPPYTSTTAQETCEGNGYIWLAEDNLCIQ